MWYNSIISNCIDSKTGMLCLCKNYNLMGQYVWPTVGYISQFSDHTNILYFILVLLVFIFTNHPKHTLLNAKSSNGDQK